MEHTEPGDLKQDDYFNIWNTMLQNINAENLDLTQIVAQAISRLSPTSRSAFES